MNLYPVKSQSPHPNQKSGSGEGHQELKGWIETSSSDLTQQNQAEVAFQCFDWEKTLSSLKVFCRIHKNPIFYLANFDSLQDITTCQNSFWSFWRGEYWSYNESIFIFGAFVILLCLVTNIRRCLVLGPNWLWMMSGIYTPSICNVQCSSMRNKHAEHARVPAKLGHIWVSAWK